MAYKRCKGDKRIQPGCFQVKFMVNGEKALEFPGNG